MAIAVKGLRLKPKYEELINVAVSDKLYNIKFPNRNASFLRNGFVLSQLDGEGMRQMEKQQEMASKESYKEHLLKQLANNNSDNVSHHSFRTANESDLREQRIGDMLNQGTQYFDINDNTNEAGINTDRTNTAETSINTDRTNTAETGLNTDRTNTAETGFNTDPDRFIHVSDYNTRVHELQRDAYLDRQEQERIHRQNLQDVQQTAKRELDQLHATNLDQQDEIRDLRGRMYHMTVFPPQPHPQPSRQPQ